jgi:magnesium transporter
MSAGAAPAGLDSLVGGYVRLFPGQVARSLEEASPGEAAALLAAQPPASAADVMRRLSPGQAAAVLVKLPDGAARLLLDQLGPDRATALLARLQPDERDRLLGLLPAPLAKELRDLAGYPADTAGALMDPRVTAFPGDVRVETVLGRLRRLGQRRVYDVYVVDTEGRVSGAVPL